MKRNMKSLKTLRGLGLMRGIWLSVGFLCLGFMTACSDVRSEVRNEVVANKQSTSESKSKKFGTIDGATKADRSLWNLSYKQDN